jgi:hypothetical protein
MIRVSSARDTVNAWADKDRRSTFSVGDHEAIDGTFSIRELIVDLALRQPTDDDLYDACASLGRLMARQHASPTLVSITVDHARDAFGAANAAWLTGSRAAVLEGYSAARGEMAEEQGRLAWEFPRCSVNLGEGDMAIAAGYPSDDHEVLAAWAARTAKSAALAGARRAFVSGPECPRRAMTEALCVAGIGVVDRRQPETAAPER